MGTGTEELEIPIVDHGGHPHWVWPDGTLRPVVGGGADGADDDDEDDLDDEDEDEDDDDDDRRSRGKKGKPNKGAIFTQRQMNAIATREKRDGRKAGRNEVLQELGFSSLEEAKAALAGKKASSGNNKEDDTDDADSKAAQEALKAKREAEEAKAEAARIKFESKLERKLLAAGAKPGKVERMVALLGLEVDASDDEIEEAIDDLADELPALFDSSDYSDDDEDDEDQGQPRGRRQRGTDTPPRKRKLPDSTTGGERRRKGKQAPAKERARARLAQRHPRFVQNKS